MGRGENWHGGDEGGEIVRRTGFLLLTVSFLTVEFLPFFFDDSEARQAAGKLDASQQGKARLGKWDECQVRLIAKHGNRQTGRWM